MREGRRIAHECKLVTFECEGEILVVAGSAHRFGRSVPVHAADLESVELAILRLHCVRNEFSIVRDGVTARSRHARFRTGREIPHHECRTVVLLVKVVGRSAGARRPLRRRRRAR